MIDALLALDRELFLLLNNLGSERYDGFWKFITRQINWLPFFLFMAWVVFKSLGWRKMLLLLGVLGVMMVFTDQTTNLAKNTFERLRPCSNPNLDGLMREVISRSSFSFFSGHACNSMAAAVYLMLILRPHVRHIGWLFLWPLIFAYSRIYLGVHYPLDIMVGFAAGATFGWVFYKLYGFILNKYFPKLNDPAHGESVANRE